MDKPYRIQVFGKPGCDKCTVLNRRLDKIITEEKFKGFSKVYQNVESVDGLVEFTKTECMNPSRIPGFIIQKWDEAENSWKYIPQTSADKESSKILLYSIVGIQTDYSGEGKGLLSPKQIKKVLESALAEA